MINNAEKLGEDRDLEIAALEQTLRETQVRLHQLTSRGSNAEADPACASPSLLLAQNQLKESNEILRLLAENITDAFWIRSPDMSEVIYVSPGFERIWGRPVATLRSNPSSWTEFIFPEDRARVIDSFARLMVDSPTLEIEYRIQRPSGELRWVRARGFQVRDVAGELIRHTGIVTDITESKRAEDARGELSARTASRERMLRTALSSTSDFTYVFDRDGRILFANQPLLDLWGLNLEDAEGKNFHDLGYPPELAGRLQDQIQAVFQTEQRLTDEAPYTSLAGLTGYYEYILSPIFEPDGTIEFVVGSTREITERRRAEEELRRSKLRYSSLFENMLEGFAYCEMLYEGGQAEDFVYLGTNNAFEELTGLTDVTGKRISQVLPAFRAADSELFEVYKRVVRTGQSEKCETYLKSLDIWLSIAVYSPGKDHFVAVFDNITSRKLSEQALRQVNDELEVRVTERTADLEISNANLRTARDEAERANREKSAFLSRMSHELRTPMNAILGFGQLLELSALDEDQRSNLSYVVDGGQHLLKLINEVLDIARVEAGSTAMSLEPVELDLLLQECVSLMAPLAAERSINLQLEASAGWAGADTLRLRQIVLNLLSNAIKYNTKGERVTARVIEKPEDKISIEIEDTGPGISPENLNRLFTPFDRLGAESSGVEGTGLGLSLSRVLAEAMGGSISVRSEEGKGSRFRINLARIEAPQPLSDKPGEAPPPGGAEGIKTTVLVIEDNLTNTKLLERFFTRNPEINLITTMQGRTGLQLAADHKPNVILLDLNLPDMHGFEVLTAIRKDPELMRIPVIIMSADGFDAQVKKMMGAGAFRYLTKPFALTDLTEAIDAAVSQPRLSST